MIWPTAMVTGHRPQHLHPEARPWVRSELRRLAVKLRDEHGTVEGVSGMALGTDLWWAAEALAAGLKLWAHIPFPQQPDKWTAEDRAEWERLCRVADRLKTYGGRYEVGFLHARNDGMIEVAQVGIAVHDPSKTTGGTASAVRKLLDLGLPIIHVDPVARTTRLRNAEVLA